MILFLLLGLLLAMPVTERVWHGDEFLRGGHDMELCLLGVLTFSGMVAVAAQEGSVSTLLSRLFGNGLQRVAVSRVGVLLGEGMRHTPCLPRGPGRCIDLTVPLSLLCLRI